MEWFAKQGSIVREIWGNADTILFIFAGASAEFALNKSVDWLYYTGKLPADPLGRLFSTVTYARRIVFAERSQALKAIDQITSIHKSVESQRGAQIPASAYRDVLFMLIDYSIRSFELLQRKLTEAEKAEIFFVFNEVGQRMGIPDLPASHPEWVIMRDEHLRDNLIKSHFSVDLYKQYKKHLGVGRYELLRQVQAQICPTRVTALFSLHHTLALNVILPAYKAARIVRLHTILRNLILPDAYRAEVIELDTSI